jgi:stage III sporulation protein AB
MLNDFLNSLGFADSKTEYERCELYIGLLNNRADEAQKQYLELNRLYKNIGVLSGILICIFFL